MSIEADGPAATIDPGTWSMPCPLEHVQEESGLAVPDARDQRERQPQRPPVPRDVERATARQHGPVGQIAIEAQRAEQQRLRRRRVLRRHRPASTSTRASPSSRKQSSRTSTTLLICQNASTDRWPQPSG